MFPTPTTWSGTFSALLVVRMVAAAVAPIADCDETFNYWEPMHYILNHTGMQTWEYSAEFALRSYTYLWLHAWPGAICQAMGLSRSTAFYATRAALGFTSALAETTFLRALGKRLGEDTRNTTFWLLLSNAGMFFCSIAFVPSATCMTSVLLAMALFLNNRLRAALTVASFAVLLCWPFCVLMFIPMGIAALFTLGVVAVGTVAVGCVVVFLLLPSALDSVLYYNKPVFPVANIVMYNAFGNSNAELYGTEPWYFYLINLALNLNIIAPLALVSLPVWMVARACARPDKSTYITSNGRLLTIVCFAPLYTSAIFFSAQAHKEERFLFPLYPIFCLAASITVHSTASTLERLASVLKTDRAAETTTPNTSRIRSTLQGSIMALTVALSLSRIVAFSTSFSAPLEIFEELSSHADLVSAAERKEPETSTPSNKLVCLGSEWYRFPTSFLLPENHIVGFVDSGFGGLLPQQFPEWPTGTSSAPEGLNGNNKPNPSALRKLSECDFFVDMGIDAWKGLNRTMEVEAERLEERVEQAGNKAVVGEPGWDKKKVWAHLACRPFLSVEHSRSPWRSFALPQWVVPQGALKYEPYCLFERRTVSIADL